MENYFCENVSKWLSSWPDFVGKIADILWFVAVVFLGLAPPQLTVFVAAPGEDLSGVTDGHGVWQPTGHGVHLLSGQTLHHLWKHCQHTPMAYRKKFFLNNADTRVVHIVIHTVLVLADYATNSF